MTKTYSKDLSILFLSCDKYSDLWDPLFYAVDKYWSSCPFDILLGSNTIVASRKNITTLLSGPDKDWSSSLLKILKQVKTPYIFLWLDDSFPIEKVQAEKFHNALHFVKTQKVKFLHSSPSPLPDKIAYDQRYGIYPSGAPYRIVVQGLWDVSYLRSILIPGENPWNFEIMGSYRTMYDDGFCCTMEPMFRYINVVEKGKIFRESFKICQKHKIPIENTNRELLESGSFIKSEMQKLIFNSMIKVPWRVRVNMMNTLRRIFISY